MDQWFPSPFIESNNTINDNSIAFILEYKHFRALFTGDAGVAAERRFLNEGIDLHADVLMCLKSASMAPLIAVPQHSLPLYIRDTQ